MPGLCGFSPMGMWGIRAALPEGQRAAPAAPAGSRFAPALSPGLSRGRSPLAFFGTVLGDVDIRRGIRFLCFKPAGADGDFETHPELAVGLGWMSKPDPLGLQRTRNPPTAFSPCCSSPFLLPYIRLPSPALALGLLCFAGDVLGLIPGLSRTGDVGSSAVFRWGEGPKPLETEGNVPGVEAQGGVSPARRFPALPAVFGGLGSPEGAARCLFEASGGSTGWARTWLSGVERFPLLGSCSALLSRTDSSRCSALALGNSAKAVSQSGGRGGRVPAARVCSEWSRE